MIPAASLDTRSKAIRTCPVLLDIGGRIGRRRLQGSEVSFLPSELCTMWLSFGFFAPLPGRTPARFAFHWPVPFLQGKGTRRLKEQMNMNVSKKPGAQTWPTRSG